MAQPSGQVGLASGHTSEYFYYANGTGLWDANNQAMLSKTGSGAVSTEGGANVINANGSTYFALPSNLVLSGDFTIAVKCRLTAANDAAMLMGDASTTNSFIWLHAGSDTINFRAPSDNYATGNTGQTTMATYHFVKSSTALKVYKNGTYLSGFGSVGGTFTITNICDGYYGNSLALNGALEFVHIIPGVAADASTISSLYSDPYQVLVAGGTPFLVVSDGVHAHGADNIALTIIGTLSIADSSHSHTSNSITLTATSNGTITIPAVRDWGTKALKTGQTGVQVDIRNIATGALVVRKTGQTTHATTGVCVVTDAAIVAGTTYEVVTRFADGSRGMWDYTAT